MDVLAQASSVVERAEAGSGRVTLTLDLDDASQRAAYAAALAVLQIHGIDPLTLTEIGVTDEEAGEASVTPPPRAARAGGGGDAAGEPGVPGTDAALRRSYADALAELAPDDARKDQVLKDTFPRVRELLRDGANVEAVAQIQYRRWQEEHLDTLRN